MNGTCFVCQGGTGVVSEMTDGTFSTTICDGCRELVTPLFFIHRDLMTAVLEAAQAKRGNKARAEAFGYPVTWGDEG